MRALCFDLPDINEDYKINCQPSELHCAIYDFEQWLREPHNNFNAEACREKLWEFLRERNIDLI